jgi:hypothetical protein
MIERAVHIKHCKHCGESASGKSDKVMYCSPACRQLVYRLKSKGFSKYGVISTKKNYVELLNELSNPQTEYIAYKRTGSSLKRDNSFNEYIVYKRSLK